MVHAIDSTVRADRLEELMHQVRASVAGIAAASRLLRGKQERVRGLEARRLEVMLESELGRLERLLGGDLTEPSGPRPLDAVVDDVLLSHLVRGVDVRWRPASCAEVTSPAAVQEALHVLLTNAARHAPGARVTVSVTQYDGSAEIRVADDGPGVPAELRDRLFVRGVRAPGSPGQGLGLYLARRLLVDLGGALRLEPTARGATFVMVLPTWAEQVAA
jgi:signal transduction histidine kinase